MSITARKEKRNNIEKLLSSITVNTPFWTEEKDLADTEDTARPLKINRRSETSACPLQTGNKKMMKGREYDGSEATRNKAGVHINVERLLNAFNAG